MGDLAKTAVLILLFLIYAKENKFGHTLMLVEPRSIILAGLAPP